MNLGHNRTVIADFALTLLSKRNRTVIADFALTLLSKRNRTVIADFALTLLSKRAKQKHNVQQTSSSFSLDMD